MFNDYDQHIRTFNGRHIFNFNTCLHRTAYLISISDLFFLNATCAFYLFQINRLTSLFGSDYIHLTIERKSDHAKSVQKTRSVPVSATLVTPPTPSHDVTDSSSPWGPTPPRRTRVSSYTSPRYRPTTIHVSSPM